MILSSTSPSCCSPWKTPPPSTGLRQAAPTPAPPAHLPRLELSGPGAVASRELRWRCAPPRHRDNTVLVASASVPTEPTASTSSPPARRGIMRRRFSSSSSSRAPNPLRPRPRRPALPRCQANARRRQHRTRAVDSAASLLCSPSSWPCAATSPSFHASRRRVRPPWCPASLPRHPEPPSRRCPHPEPRARPPTAQRPRRDDREPRQATRRDASSSCCDRATSSPCSRAVTSCSPHRGDRKLHLLRAAGLPRPRCVPTPTSTVGSSSATSCPCAELRHQATSSTSTCSSSTSSSLASCSPPAPLTGS